METYLTIKEVAELKGCSTRYLRQAALSGTVKAKKNSMIRTDRSI